MVAVILVLTVPRAGACRPELIWWRTKVRNTRGRCESSPLCKRTSDLTVEAHAFLSRLENKDFS